MFIQFRLQPDLTTGKKIDKASYDAEIAEAKSKLDAIKARMDLPNIKFFSFDPFLKIKHNYKMKYNVQHMTNAWLKFYEMIYRYRMFDTIAPNSTVLTLYFIL